MQKCTFKTLGVSLLAVLGLMVIVGESAQANEIQIESAPISAALATGESVTANR